MPVRKIFTHLANPFTIGKDKYPSFPVSINTRREGFTLSIPPSGLQITFIKIYDSGKNYLGELKVMDGMIQIPDLPDGRYFFKAHSDDGNIVMKGKFDLQAE